MLLKQESYRVRKAVYEVNREMGCGFLESVYQECLMAEFENVSIPFVAQPKLKITYKGRHLTQCYIPDFVCYGKIIVELKSVKNLLPEHQAQIINYLRASKLEVGFLVNFGTSPKAQIQRFVKTVQA